MPTLNPFYVPYQILLNAAKYNEYYQLVDKESRYAKYLRVGIEHEFNAGWYFDQGATEKATHFYSVAQQSYVLLVAHALGALMGFTPQEVEDQAYPDAERARHET